LTDAGTTELKSLENDFQTLLIGTLAMFAAVFLLSLSVLTIHYSYTCRKNRGGISTQHCVAV